MSRRDGSIAIGMVAAVALVAAAPVVIAELAGGDALAVGVSVTFVAAGILWSRKRFRSGTAPPWSACVIAARSTWKWTRLRTS